MPLEVTGFNVQIRSSQARTGSERVVRYLRNIERQARATRRALQRATTIPPMRVGGVAGIRRLRTRLDGLTRAYNRVGAAAEAAQASVTRPTIPTQSGGIANLQASLNGLTASYERVATAATHAQTAVTRPVVSTRASGIALMQTRLKDLVVSYEAVAAAATKAQAAIAQPTVMVRSSGIELLKGRIDSLTLSYQALTAAASAARGAVAAVPLRGVRAAAAAAQRVQAATAAGAAVGATAVAAPRVDPRQVQAATTATAGLARASRRAAGATGALVNAQGELVLTSRQVSAASRAATRALGVPMIAPAVAGTERMRRSLQQTGAQAQATTAQMATMGRTATTSANAAAASYRRMGTALTGMRGTLLGLAGLFGVIAGVAEIKEFEVSMARIGAITRASEADMKSMTQTARELGATTIFRASEAAKGMFFLSRAGLSTKETIQAIPATLNLATAAMIDLGDASRITANVLRAMQIEADEAERVTDVLAATANRSNTDILQLGDAFKFAGTQLAVTGQSVETATALFATLADMGRVGSVAGSGVNRVVVQLGQLARADTKKAQLFREELEKIGVSAEQVDPSLNDMSDVVIRLAEGMDRFGNYTMSRDAVQFFGYRGGPTFQALIQGVEKLKQMRMVLADVEGEAQRTADALNNTLFGAAKRLVSALGELVLGIGDAGLKGSLVSILDAITNVVRVMAGMEQSIERHRTMWIVIGRAVETALLSFMAFGAIRLAAWFWGATAAIRAFYTGLTVAVVRSQTMGVAMSALALRFRTLRAMMLTSGWGILAVAIGVAAEAYLRWKDRSREATDKLKEQQEQIEKVDGAVKTLGITLSTAADTKAIDQSVKRFNAYQTVLSETTEKAEQAADAHAKLDAQANRGVGIWGTLKLAVRGAISALEDNEKQINNTADAVVRLRRPLILASSEATNFGDVFRRAMRGLPGLVGAIADRVFGLFRYLAELGKAKDAEEAAERLRALAYASDEVKRRVSSMAATIQLELRKLKIQTLAEELAKVNREIAGFAGPKTGPGSEAFEALRARQLAVLDELRIRAKGAAQSTEELSNAVGEVADELDAFNNKVREVNFGIFVAEQLDLVDPKLRDFTGKVLEALESVNLLDDNFKIKAGFEEYARKIIEAMARLEEFEAKQRRLIELQERAAKAIENVAGPYERANEKIKELTEAFPQMVDQLGSESKARAVLAANIEEVILARNKELDALEERNRERAIEALPPFERGWIKEYEGELDTMDAKLERMGSVTARNLEDALTDAFTNPESAMDSFEQAFEALRREFMKEFVVKPIMREIGNVMGAIIPQVEDTPPGEAATEAEAIAQQVELSTQESARTVSDTVTVAAADQTEALNAAAQQRLDAIRGVLENVFGSLDQQVVTQGDRIVNAMQSPAGAAEPGTAGGPNRPMPRTVEGGAAAQCVLDPEPVEPMFQALDEQMVAQTDRIVEAINALDMSNDAVTNSSASSVSDAVNEATRTINTQGQATQTTVDQANAEIQETNQAGFEALLRVSQGQNMASLGKDLMDLGDQMAGEDGIFGQLRDWWSRTTGSQPGRDTMRAEAEREAHMEDLLREYEQQMGQLNDSAAEGLPNTIDTGSAGIQDELDRTSNRSDVRMQREFERQNIQMSTDASRVANTIDTRFRNVENNLQASMDALAGQAQYQQGVQMMQSGLMMMAGGGMMMGGGGGGGGGIGAMGGSGGEAAASGVGGASGAGAAWPVDVGPGGQLFYGSGASGPSAGGGFALGIENTSSVMGNQSEISMILHRNELVAPLTPQGRVPLKIDADGASVLLPGGREVPGEVMPVGRAVIPQGQTSEIVLPFIPRRRESLETFQRGGRTGPRAGVTSPPRHSPIWGEDFFYPPGLYTEPRHGVGQPAHVSQMNPMLAGALVSREMRNPPRYYGLVLPSATGQQTVFEGSQFLTDPVAYQRVLQVAPRPRRRGGAASDGVFPVASGDATPGYLAWLAVGETYRENWRERMQAFRRSHGYLYTHPLSQFYLDSYTGVLGVGRGQQFFPIPRLRDGRAVPMRWPLSGLDTPLTGDVFEGLSLAERAQLIGYGPPFAMDYIPHPSPLRFQAPESRFSERAAGYTGRPWWNVTREEPYAPGWPPDRPGTIPPGWTPPGGGTEPPPGEPPTIPGLPGAPPPSGPVQPSPGTGDWWKQGDLGERAESLERIRRRIRGEPEPVIPTDWYEDFLRQQGPIESREELQTTENRAAMVESFSGAWEESDFLSGKRGGIPGPGPVSDTVDSFAGADLTDRVSGTAGTGSLRGGLTFSSEKPGFSGSLFRQSRLAYGGITGGQNEIPAILHRNEMVAPLLASGKVPIVVGPMGIGVALPGNRIVPGEIVEDEIATSRRRITGPEQAGNLVAPQHFQFGGITGGIGSESRSFVRRSRADTSGSERGKTEINIAPGAIRIEAPSPEAFARSEDQLAAAAARAMRRASSRNRR